MSMICVISSTMVIQIWKEPWKSTRISALLWGFTGIMNYRFLTTETNSKALYIFRCSVTTSSVKLFLVTELTVQIFVYKGEQLSQIWMPTIDSFWRFSR